MAQRTDDNSVNNEGGIIESHGSLDGSVSGNFGESGGSLTVLLPSQVGQSIQVHEVSKMKTVLQIPDQTPYWEYSDDKPSGDIWEAPHSLHSFTPVETPQIGSDTFGDDTTATALENCKKTVLRPYHIFLKAIGWRKFQPPVYDMQQPLHYRCCNILWPLVLTVLLLISCVTQILLCFSRDLILPNQPDSNGTYNITCSSHIFSSLIVLDILLVGTYLYGLFVFRFKLPEYLSTFTETVFLGIISRKGNYSPKQLIRSLQFLLILGVSWVIYSFMVSIVRIFAHHLNISNYHVNLEFLKDSSPPVRIVLVAISLLGFIVFDVAYIAVVINYSMQCQLMIYYLQSICTRIQAKEWEIDEAIKQVHNARQFLSKLNSHLSRAVGGMIFIFLYSSVLAMYGLQKIKHGDHGIVFLAVTGFLATIQWTSLLFLPLIQAARVTRSGYWLRKVALEIRSRPYSYKDTPQLDLDSFVSYCSNVHMKAKLISVPISPQIVVGGAFFLGFVLFLVFEFDNYSWAPWL